MLIGTSKGLPGEFLLLFAVLIWVLFFLIYLVNKKSVNIKPKKLKFKLLAKLAPAA